MSLVLSRCAAWVLAATLAVGAPALLAQTDDDRTRGRDCSQTSIGASPIPDLGTGLYEGAQGGLYPDGSNTVPPAHLDLGLARAAEIVPRAGDGRPSEDGAIGFMSLGVSNTAREFSTFMASVAAEPALSPSIVFANGAQGGAALDVWLDPGSPYWDDLGAAVTEAGLTPAQVQVAWVKMVARIDAGNPAQPFPDDALTYQENLTTVLGMVQERFPNLAVAYLSSRIYGGYNTTDSPSPEPWAYQQGYGVKWAIESQISGEAAMDATPGSARVPWLAWGPYLWADGETPRGDGLTWVCRDMRGDGVHPSERGQEKVAAMLIEFLRDEPTAAWMWTDRDLQVPGSLPTTTVPPEPTSTSQTTVTFPNAETIPPTPSTRPADSAPPTTVDRQQDRRATPIVWTIIVVALIVVAVGTWMGTRRRRSGDANR